MANVSAFQEISSPSSGVRLKIRVGPEGSFLVFFSIHSFCLFLLSHSDAMPLGPCFLVPACVDIVDNSLECSTDHYENTKGWKEKRRQTSLPWRPK